MSDASRAYRVALWVSEKGLKDIEALTEKFSALMRGILSKIEPERLAHDLAKGEQWEELVELELLKSTLAVKQFAEQSGGFDESHGPALETAANALYEHCGWEDEDIAEWFGSLVLGAGVSVEMTFEDEDEG
jgi:hypothetical protein